MGYLNLAGLGRFYTGLKGKFLLQSNVVNNLTTTAAGKALDGRQGKALKELIESGKTEVLGSVAYTHAKTGTNHNFVGTGKLGYAVMTAGYADGDTVSVNGTAATVVGDLSGAITGAAAAFSVSGSTLYVYDIASPFTIPDGDTVLTLNDAGIWLSCAGVNPATVGNPTISQLVANQSYCETLMNSANAVNYMIRSTTIQTAVLASTTAITALDASTPFVSAEMTSNNAPLGYEASAISTRDNSSNDTAYRATILNPNGDASNIWQGSLGAVPNSVTIKLPAAVWAYKIKVNARQNTGGTVTSRIQGSNDNLSWTDVTEAFEQTGGMSCWANTASAVIYQAKPTATQYRYYRVYITSLGSNAGYSSICCFQIYGKKMEV